MKKTPVLFLAFILLFTLLCLPVSADEPEAEADPGEDMDITVFLNGTGVDFDAVPMIVDGRTYVPVSAIARLLGAQIEWVESVREVKISLDGKSLNMFIGSTYMEFNMVPFHNETVPFISNGRTMVPLRIISEYLGCDVDYIALLKRVLLTTHKPIYYTFENNVLDIYSKYSDTQDIMVRMKQTGTNSLFDFSEIYLISNFEPYVKSNLSDSFLFYRSSTDWHAPIIINVNENSASDEHHAFTGGNHGYSGNSDGARTARLDSVYLEADGKSITHGSGYCSNLTVTWKNLVQASNTKEASGWGREVLEESHILSFDGTTFFSDVTLTPLEDMEIDLVYGFAAEIKYTWDEKIEYENPLYKISYPGNIQSNAGEAGCLSVTCTRGGNAVKMSLDTTYGLGERNNFTSLTNGAFCEPYGKVYFNLVNGKPIQAKANDKLCYRGSYKFYSLSQDT